MKLKLNKVMLINLMFRIFLLVYLLQEDELKRPNKTKPLKHWMDPVSKRVFLILINGLQRDFLEQNSTPYLKNVIQNYGAFGVVFTEYMETNLDGLRTILTGRKSPLFFYTWLKTFCPDSILDYLGFKCGIGRIPKEISLQCYFPEEHPLENFHKFPGLFSAKNYKSSLYIMSLDLDPVWIKNYRERLKKIDEDIRFLSTTVDSIYGDNKTTYIVTAARGSPVGGRLSLDSPLVAWGAGIAYNSEVTYLLKIDLTAMLCVLLGVNFPSGLFGIIPMNMMDLHDYFVFEYTLYSIKHFETVLEVADMKDHLVDTSELEIDQLETRLDHIVLEIRKSKFKCAFFSSIILILLLTLWSLNLISCSSTGFAYFFLHLRSLFMLLIVIGITLTYKPIGVEMIVALELVIFWIWQNFGKVYASFSKNITIIVQGTSLTFTAVTLVGIIGNHIAIPVMMLPVVSWPIFDNSYKNLNRFVFATRLMSGLALSAMPLTKVFGEMPNMFFTTSMGFLFLGNFYIFQIIFKSKVDAHIKINFFMILVTIACLRFPDQNQYYWVKQSLLCFLLAFSLLFTYACSGTLLNRLFKIFLSLFIPVLMLSMKIECVFYFSIVFHTFTWIFIEYHKSNAIEFQFYPSIFSVKPMKPLQPILFSVEDSRQIVFFVVYCYLSYFAIGHFPDLHSYDLYVIPAFIYDYPKIVSYFLAGLKFFLPFFIVTTSFMTMCALKEKDFKPLIMASIWLSDVIGCCLIFYSQLFNLIIERTVFPAKFSYFFIQQFATISVILSYFVGKHLLFGEKFLIKLFEGKNVLQQES